MSDSNLPSYNQRQEIKSLTQEELHDALHPENRLLEYYRQQCHVLEKQIRQQNKAIKRKNKLIRRLRYNQKRAYINMCVSETLFSGGMKLLRKLI